MVRSAAPEAPPAPPRDRVIRVFVSSTFRDMREEREELVKFVFPRLRRLCESRGVVWGEVDLRWGITDEQKAEGRVLPICLEQIRRCRPYFIGLLGERYGSLPDALPEGLLAKEPWLEDARGRSVTELEILHGVLNDPAMAAHAYFYLRDPSYIDGLPERERADHLDTPEGRDKAARLKDRIRASGFPVRENYQDPRELGRLVLEDMTRLIDALFPADTPPDPLAEEAAGQEAFIRDMSRVYVARLADYEALDRQAACSGPPLVVTGEAGIGKSALLANWVRRFRAEHPDVPVIAHFIRATPASVEEAFALRRLAAELDRAFDLGLDPPEDPRRAREAFSRALALAGRRGGRAVVVIDGLDRLEGRRGPSDANWIPAEIPPSVRLILGCGPDPVLDQLKRRGWPAYEVAPLSADDRRAFIRSTLKLHAKTLGGRHEDMILAAELSAHPLFLKTLLDELRQFGSHEELESRLASYLRAPTVPAIFSLVAARYEEDYERDRPGLVGDAFTLFYAANRGLAEAELLDLLGQDGAPLPQAIWAPLFLAAEGLLADRGGILSLNSPLVRTAFVAGFAGPGSAVAVHRRLAAYFRTRENGPRKLEELPVQLWMADDMAGMRDALADLPFFKAMVERDLDATANIWERLEREGFDFFETYRPVLKDPFEHGDYVFPVLQVMSALDHVQQSVVFGRLLVEWLKVNQDDAGAALALNNLGYLYEKANELEDALNAFVEAEVRARAGASEAELTRSLRGRTQILKRLGRIGEALAANEAAAELARRRGDRRGLMNTLRDQAILLDRLGDKAAAKPLFKDAEALAREEGDELALIAILIQLADLVRLEPDLEAAERYVAELESIFERGVAGFRMHGSFLALKGRMESDRGHPEEARRIFDQLRELGREQGDVQIESEGQYLAAVTLYNEGEHARSLPLFREVSIASRAIKDLNVLLESLAGEAHALHALKETEAADAVYKEAETLAEEIGLPNRLIDLLGDHAGLFYRAGRSAEAHALWDRLDALVERVENARVPIVVLLQKAECAIIESDWAAARRLTDEVAGRIEGREDDQDRPGLLSLRARIVYHDGNYRESLDLYTRLETFGRGAKDRKWLAEARGGQALCHHFLGDDDRAVAAFVEAEAVAGELGRWDWAAENGVNRARILRGKGRTPEALEAFRAVAEAAAKAARPDLVRAALSEQFRALYELQQTGEAAAILDEWERACREAGDAAGLRMALNDRAALLMGQGRQAEAVPVLTEAVDIARRMGATADLARMLGHLASALYNTGATGEARAVLSEKESVSRAAGDDRSLAETLIMRGWDLAHSGDDAGAIPLLLEAEGLCQRLGVKDSQRHALLYLAESYYRTGRFAEAAGCAEQGEAIDRGLGRLDDLQADLGVRAAALWGLNRQPDALKLYEEQERVLRQTARPADLAVCLSHQANLRRQLGDAEGALRVLPEAENAARQAGDKATLAQVLANWSEILMARQAWDEVLAVWTRAEANAVERGDQRGLWYYLYVQAHTLAYRKQDARAGLAKAEALARLPSDAAPDERSLKAALEMRDQLRSHLGIRG